jgi:hypothetical protein
MARHLLLKFCNICNRSDCSEERHQEDAPVAVVLKFKNRADRNFFMGQLSDGFGENHVTLAWDTTTLFEDATEFDVVPTPLSAD